MSELLAATSVSFSYTDKPVLRVVSVSLHAGEIVALLGPNGSGKTTLIRVLLGHLHALSGQIQWDQREIRSWPRRELAKRVAYLPQTPTLLPDQRVIDALRLGRAPYLQAFGLESSRDIEVLDRVVEQLELAEIVNRPLDKLSGGQRQRVFVGRCLVQEPAAMLLDEPSTFLDLKAQIELSSLLKKLAKDQKIGVLMASHDLNLAAGLADRVILLKSGQLVRAGTPDEVLQPDLLESVYGIPMQRIEGAGRIMVVPKM